MASKRDYYEILEVDKTATAAEIKRAYRKLAQQHHPDKEGGDSEKFKELSEAYAVLSDESKRKSYDQYGHAGAGDPFGGQNPFAGGGFNPNDFDMSGFGGFGDIFDMFFRGQQGGGGRQANRDIEVAMDIDFADAIHGAEKQASIDLNDTCDRCHGTAAEPGSKMSKCHTCNGAGQVTHVQRTILGDFRQAAVCPTCHGRREVPDKPCTKCNGAGMVRATKNLTIKIPAGVDNGTTLQIRGEGAAGPSGGKGDLYVHLRVRPDRRFQRQGAHIYSDAKIGMAQAALGVEIPVETVEGEVKLKVPAGTQSGKVFKLSGRGMAHIGSSRKGDHLVTVTVQTPTKLSAKQKELLEQFAADGGKKGFW